MQIKPAIEAVKKAKQNLSKAKDAYSEYKQDLVQQQAQLQALKDQLAHLVNVYLFNIASIGLQLVFECLKPLKKPNKTYPRQKTPIRNVNKGHNKSLRDQYIFITLTFLQKKFN